jgi:hypothetical protein
MWRVGRLEKRSVTLDFTSSGQGRPTTHQLLADDVLFANALGFTDWQELPVQLLVCESCGVVGCEPGGRLDIVRVGQFAVFVPAFAPMLENGIHEYAAPEYSRTRGAPLFSAHGYLDLRRTIDCTMPAFEALRPMQGAELVRLLQWEAPIVMLGRFPDQVQLRRPAVLAVSEGDVDVQAAELRRLIDSISRATTPVSLREQDASGVPVTFHLDHGAEDWQPMVRRAGVPLLSFRPGLVADISGE